MMQSQARLSHMNIRNRHQMITDSHACPSPGLTSPYTTLPEPWGSGLW
jgi:hypothetical protein